jgi:hypothetical protein
MNPRKRITALEYNQPQIATLEGPLKAIQSTQKGMPPWWFDFLVPPRDPRFATLTVTICAYEADE